MTFALSDFVQIDDSDRVVWHERSEDGLFTNIKRIGRSGQDFLIVARNHAPPFQTSPFDLPLDWITMNNNGETVFSADIGSVQGPVKTQFGYHLLEVTSRTE